MQSALFALLLVAAAAGSSHAATCPNPPTNDTISIKAYMGTWYEIATTEVPRTTFEKNTECTEANYALNADGTVLVNNTSTKTTDNTTDTAIGKAIQVAGGKLKVSFFGPFYGPYWVTQLYGAESSGYEVAVIFSCTNEIVKTSQSMWILSRTPTLPAGFTIEMLSAKAVASGIDVASLGLTATVQKGCSY